MDAYKIIKNHTGNEMNGRYIRKLKLERTHTSMNLTLFSNHSFKNYIKKKDLGLFHIICWNLWIYQLFQIILVIISCILWIRADNDQDATGIRNEKIIRFKPIVVKQVYILLKKIKKVGFHICVNKKNRHGAKKKLKMKR